MLNKVSLIGRLGRDVELRQTQKGDAVANISVATTEKWKKNNETQEKTEWHRVVMFGKVAEIANLYLHKGSMVYIEGSLQTRKWEDKEGNEKHTTEIVVAGYGGIMKMLDPNGSQSKDVAEDQTDLNDDIPF